MEPRRDDGDDWKEPLAVRNRTMAPQWSPVVTTGTTMTPPRIPAPAVKAAMEPRRDDGDDDDAPAYPRAGGQGRNGAPS